MAAATVQSPLPQDYSYLDEIPSSMPASRQRVYSRLDLETYNLLPYPVWVFDVRNKAMWWANEQGVELWSADSLEDLVARDFAEGMSKASENSMNAWLEKFHQDGTTNHRVTWTFHPKNGTVGPKSCDICTSGIYVTNATSTADSNSKPWFCMLVVVEKVVEGAERSEEDARTIRQTEMLRHFPIIARQFNFEGNLVDQNPEAMAVFGSPSNATPSESVAPLPQKRKTRKDDDGDTPMNAASDRTDSTAATTTTASGSTPSSTDFLSQFVDIEEGKQVWEEVRQGNDYSTETLQYTKGGGQVWFSIDVRQVWDAISSEKVVIYSARDISKLMQYAKEQVEKQNQARNEFFAVMAHEIRTPLHQVIGSMELLSRSKLDDDQADNMQILQTSSKAMMAIINDALDFTKLEAGRLALENIQFKIRGVVDGCVAAVQQQAESKGLRIEKSVEERIPAWLVGDPNRFRQVLMNLLTNAVKFSPQQQQGDGSTIQVRVNRLMNDASSHRVVLQFSVKDLGIGIAPERQALIFDAYQQADTTVSRTYGGTGLGLSICKSLVELMGGRIGVRSELNKGSTFWFEIPLQQTEEAEQQPAAAKPPQPADNSAYNILVVEDNKVNQKVICKMLQRLGHKTLVAENGQLALEALEEQQQTSNQVVAVAKDAAASGAEKLQSKKSRFDLVLMDWQMPVMDGIEATKAIRRLGHTKGELPVIGLTASIQGKDWLDVGMNECLKKPIRMNELKQALSRNMTSDK